MAYIESIAVLTRAVLMRAIVVVPDHLCRVSPIEERVVFFEAPCRTQAGPVLEQQLAGAWNVDTTDWCERGWIYNLASVLDLLSVARRDDREGMFVLETGSGGDQGIGPYRIHYTLPHATDYSLTSPRVAERLQELLARAEALHVAQQAINDARPGRDVRAQIDAWNALSDFQRGAVLHTANTASAVEAMRWLRCNVPPESESTHT